MMGSELESILSVFVIAVFSGVMLLLLLGTILNDSVQNGRWGRFFCWWGFHKKGEVIKRTEIRKDNYHVEGFVNGYDLAITEEFLCARCGKLATDKWHEGMRNGSFYWMP